MLERRKAYFLTLQLYSQSYHLTFYYLSLFYVLQEAIWLEFGNGYLFQQTIHCVRQAATISLLREAQRLPTASHYFFIHFTLNLNFVSVTMRPILPCA